MSPPDPAAPTPRQPRWGDELQATIGHYDRRGQAQGRSGPYQVRLRGAVPGDHLRFTVVKRRRKLLEGRTLEVLSPGPARVAPRCAHAPSCGGCSFQACDYPEQLLQKQRLVREALAAVGDLAADLVEPVVGCESPWAYRNKMEYSFGNRRWTEPGEPKGAPDDFALGLHAPGRYDKVLDLTECKIVFGGGEAILRDAGALAREQGLEPWDVKEHRGFLRHLVLRAGVRTNEVMVNVVTASESPVLFDDYAAALLARHPEITTLVQTIHGGLATASHGEAERVLFGPGWITEELCGARFRISPRSFFQVNTLQAERLFEIIREEAAPAGDEVVFDLYSGAGTIALALASRAGEVLAFEQVPEAVADAERNVEENGVRNVRILAGDVLHRLDEVLEHPTAWPRPAVCVVDPPRAGLHPEVLPKLFALGASRIVYVSCNLTAGAKDLARLIEGGYLLERVRPVDLFPHTPHVESVVTLRRTAP